MKVVIFAGGLGTRLSEETEDRPKPMVTIGDQPILFHIMKYYSYFGFDEFLILGGYKNSQIKEYFFNYSLHNSDFRIDLGNNNVEITSRNHENWKVSVLDTGLSTMTGGRLLRAKKYLKNDENFLLTYGDGLSDIAIDQVIATHLNSNALVTLTAVNPPDRFGVLDIENEQVVQFNEKPTNQNNLINGGFFVVRKDIFNYLEDDETVFEEYPLKSLASEGKLFCYKHTGFWQCMDTLKEKRLLNELLAKGNAPWVKND
ncbi:glucose-1-phosphate cytidylyltransferase [Planktomarina sp.]|nr:glucose-1-phosphate cytidylyltransferase [Planktomarina sp.]